MKTYIKIKVANFSGTAEELAIRYSNQAIPMPIGRDDVHKYIIIKREPTGTYFVMISDATATLVETTYYKIIYNKIITVHGPTAKRTKAIMDEVERTIKIPTEEAPEFLKRLIKELSIDAIALKEV